VGRLSERSRAGDKNQQNSTKNYKTNTKNKYKKKNKKELSKRGTAAPPETL
jgi:hypothetical protein